MRAWVRYLRAGNVAHGTISTRTAQIRRLATWTEVAPADVTTDMLVDFLAQRKWSTESRRSYRAAFVVFFQWANRYGGIEHNPAQDLPRIRPAEVVPRAATAADLARGLRIADPRESLLIRLAAFMGLRRAEAAQVHARDLRETPDGLMLVVHGKGAKDRVVPVPDILAADLRGHKGWLFPAPGGGHITAHYAGKLVSDCLPTGITMHSLRHSFATAVYGSSRDLIATQTLLGHSKPETTRGYVAFNPAGLRCIVNESMAPVPVT